MAMNVTLIPSWTSTKLPNFQLSSQANFQRFKSSTKAQACLYKYPLASKIMIRNLPYSANESSLQKEFSKFGKIAEVKLVKDEKTDRSKGYAFIQYTSQADALLAIENMDRKYFNGRAIYIDLAKPVTGEFGGYPKTSGPPEETHLADEDKELV
ncbi:OLC1v1025480C1 [Oldenlandia corymbosa var. corymbosa]|uniref:OLC1v1025480C1 n=1 Tax=Oldenlandia corymbosa var. corymbosa TaxID=529605 RepID=A0AAV1C6D1_OLDCO|nr:OLC1v1025480C1 [Oldenlandia corymbosa var. corymbosa]